MCVCVEGGGGGGGDGRLHLLKMRHKSVETYIYHCISTIVQKWPIHRRPSCYLQIEFFKKHVV